jgi:hypothetical protein
MKQFFYILILIGGLAQVKLQARLGESPEKLQERFGKPVQEMPVGVGDLRQYVYFNKDLMITVLVTKKESVLEQYVRLKEIPQEGQKPLITSIPEPLAQAILGANAEGSSWEDYESSSEIRRFIRKDQKGFAAFTMEKGIITEVRISSKEMVEFAQNLKKK